MAEGGIDEKVVPIAFISSMSVLMNTLQIVLAPADGITMTVELVQQAPDIFVEPEHTSDDDERVEVDEGAVIESLSSRDLDGDESV